MDLLDALLNEYYAWSDAKKIGKAYKDSIFSSVDCNISIVSVQPAGVRDCRLEAHHRLAPGSSFHPGSGKNQSAVECIDRGLRTRRQLPDPEHRTLGMDPLAPHRSGHIGYRRVGNRLFRINQYLRPIEGGWSGYRLRSDADAQLRA